MILIDEILVSQEIIKQKFCCDLSVCKGACCVEGDSGAPLDKEEIPIIEEILEEVLPYLSEESQKIIREEGFYRVYDDEYETHLMPDDEACVFMGWKDGITFCAIEQAYNDKKIEYKKPISCHLYPIRVQHNPKTGFTALNYDRWDICNAARAKGSHLNLTINNFATEALTRKYGEDFVKTLKEIEKDLRE